MTCRQIKYEEQRYRDTEHLPVKTEVVLISQCRPQTTARLTKLLFFSLVFLFFQDYNQPLEAFLSLL